MEVLKVQIAQRVSRAIALPLAICRAIYCWAFLLFACLALHNVFTNIRELLQKHSADTGDIVSNAVLATYTVIFAVAWWKILRGKSALKGWAIAGNSVIVLPFLPILVLGGWRSFWAEERYWLAGNLVGLLGITIFSIPYHGWRYKSQTPAEGDQHRLTN
jgi:hypothetical protein